MTHGNNEEPGMRMGSAQRIRELDENDHPLRAGEEVDII